MHELAMATGMMMNKSIYRNWETLVDSTMYYTLRTYLEVSQRRCKGVQQCHRSELDERIQRPGKSSAKGIQRLARTTHIYLKQLKLVTKAALPSLITSMTQPISGVLAVNGAATLASASESDMPTSAAFNAAQSFAPSPHMRTEYPRP